MSEPNKTVSDAIAAYIAAIAKIHAAGLATEHSYREPLIALLKVLAPDLTATNEPKRIACGAPDIILTDAHAVPVGYIETKIPFDADLEGRAANKEQFARYLAALDKIIFTDFLRFRFYERGTFKGEFTLGEALGEAASSRFSQNFSQSFSQNFAAAFADWCAAPVQSIKSAAELSRMMAGKARQIEFVIERALTADLDTAGPTDDSNATLRAQFATFKRLLIRDLSPQLFADTYAQTIVYGMFAARYHDDTLDTFDRHEAAALIPKNNPFLRSLFGYIAGPDLDDRILPFIDDLTAVFRASDVHAILAPNRRTGRDPIVHFYEDFLRDYDALFRKNRGVWYTPRPVVNFIVRGVDALLQSAFALKDGLADGSHRVQILDPACGTGTFLAEIIRFIREKPRFRQMPGIWPQYLADCLLPRLNGFELLMAPYAIAHLKLETLAGEALGEAASSRFTGEAASCRLNKKEFNSSSSQATGSRFSQQAAGSRFSQAHRFRVYLTNSLEPPNPDQASLFSYWLEQEAVEADKVKRSTPVFVVIGNPPYSGESFNKGKHITKLLDDYKRDPAGGGTVPDTKWLNDDYVKFIRFGQSLVEKTGEGILAFITPHGWLDAPTFRGMRHRLLTAFDEIYILDLHGNSRRKETAPDGSKDENVFDIMQGVEITFFVKAASPNASPIARVFHHERFGKRAEKFAWLDATAFADVPWRELHPVAPQFYLVPRNDALEAEYKKGFSIDELFTLGGVGICSKRDTTAYRDTREEMQAVVRDFAELTPDQLRAKYPTERKDSQDRTLANAIANVKACGVKDTNFCRGTYRVFDEKWTYLTNQSRGFIARPVYDVMRHLMYADNLAFCCCKAGRNEDYHNYWIARGFVTKDVVSSLDSVNVYPLYLYPNDLLQGGERTSNLNPAIVSRLEAIVCMGEASGEALGEAASSRFTGEATSCRFTGEAASCRFYKKDFNSSSSQAAGSRVSHAFLNWEQEIEATRANLPHWHQQGRLQFVTFRLADSLPQEKLAQLADEKATFEAEHPKPWDQATTDDYYEQFGTKIDAWLDANWGSCVLARPDVCRIVNEALRHFDGERYILHSFVIMPNHIHVLFELMDGNQTDKVVHSWKSWTANKINALLNTSGPLWQKEYFDRMIRNESHYQHVCAYIAGNMGEALGEAASCRLNKKEFNSTSSSQAAGSRFSQGFSQLKPIDILDYIYAVLYTPTYRERYKEFLKTDFPRVPYPESAAAFRRVAAAGARLRALHLLESDELDATPVTYPVVGDNVVDGVEYVGEAASCRLNKKENNSTSSQAAGSRFSQQATGCRFSQAGSRFSQRFSQMGRVYINATQYFGEVPAGVWEMFIGGYQPAQKWLKDRKGRTLSPAEIIHYARVIHALTLTASIMSELG